MAATHHILLSPSELAYLHTSLSQSPPIRPDGRSATQFRPLTAETGILPGANGSARVCFADGTEAIVGVKAEVEREPDPIGPWGAMLVPRDGRRPGPDSREDDGWEQGEIGEKDMEARGSDDWVQLSVEIPGLRDDDPNTVYLARMLAEALLADGTLAKRLVINSRYHWRLYLDIVLISPPLSYPLPLLSLTLHLALLATRFPRLVSESDEDPMFDDDWSASTFLFPRRKGGRPGSPPPITLLVIAVGDNIIFDPAKEELSVADAAMAVSVAPRRSRDGDIAQISPAGASEERGRDLRLLAIRTVDPPSRLTPLGVPNGMNSALGLSSMSSQQPNARVTETAAVEGVWRPPRGGVHINTMSRMVEQVVAKGGVADEVLDALDGVELA